MGDEGAPLDYRSLEEKRLHLFFGSTHTKRQVDTLVAEPAFKEPYLLYYMLVFEALDAEKA